MQDPENQGLEQEQEQDSESQPLLSQSQPKRPHSVRMYLPSLSTVSRAFGFCLVQYSMFGQAFWGMAYLDLNAFHKWAEAARLAADGNTWFTAALGKGVLVYSFADPFFSNPIQGMKDKLNLLNYSLLDIAVLPLNMLMSLNFAGLFISSSRDGARLLSKIHADELAKWTMNNVYLGTGAASSFVGNFLGWSFIWKDALLTLIRPLQYLLKNPAFRIAEETHRARCEAVRLLLKATRRTGNPEYQALVRRLFNLTDEQALTPAVLAQANLDPAKINTIFNDKNLYSSNPRSYTHLAIIGLLFVTFVAICGTGFSNFYEIGEVGFDALAWYWPKLSGVFNDLVPAAKPIALASIYAMSLSVTKNLAPKIGDFIFGYQQSDRIRSLSTYLISAIVALYVTGLGATPNMEQARLTGQNVSIQAAGGAAPVTIEWMAFFMLILNMTFWMLSMLRLSSKQEAVEIVDNQLGEERDNFSAAAAGAPSFWRPGAEKAVNIGNIGNMPIGYRLLELAGFYKKNEKGEYQRVPREYTLLGHGDEEAGKEEARDPGPKLPKSPFKHFCCTIV